MAWKAWTDAEVAELRRQLDEGLEYRAMTGCGGRSPQSLMRKANALGLHTPEVRRRHQKAAILRMWGTRPSANIAACVGVNAREVRRLAEEAGLKPEPPRAYNVDRVKRAGVVEYPPETLIWARHADTAEARWIMRMVKVGHAKAAEA